MKFDPIEAEANAFAMELLMPEDYVRSDLDAYLLEHPFADFNELSAFLSKRYQVSRELATLRIAELEYLAIGR